MEEIILEPSAREEYAAAIKKEYPPRKGILKVKCKCGTISSMSEEIIEDGLSWTMLIGNNHFLTLICPECEARLTMFIDEITVSNELPKESIEE